MTTVRVLVRGINDVGSAVAHHLYTANYAVVIHDAPQSTTSRRQMAFSDALVEGKAELAGVQAVRLDNLRSLPPLLEGHQVIPVVTSDFTTVLTTLKPQVLVDARMRKREQPESQLGLASLTIGLGPNFTAGETTDLIVETSWEDLGRVSDHGTTLPLAGEPHEIGGHARDRFIYAPVAGIFRTSYSIGAAVAAGEVVAMIGGTPVAAPLGGTLRGLTRDGVPVTVGTKVLEMDPTGATIESHLGGRPTRIAEAVVGAVQHWEQRGAPHLAPGR
jgi:xanthine dehydrogenase accessory factor